MLTSSLLCFFYSIADTHEGLTAKLCTFVFGREETIELGSQGRSAELWRPVEFHASENFQWGWAIRIIGRQWLVITGEFITVTSRVRTIRRWRRKRQNSNELVQVIKFKSARYGLFFGEAERANIISSLCESTEFWVLCSILLVSSLHMMINPNSISKFF